MLITLVSFYCIHPALKLMKIVLCTISLLGRPSCNMAFDRLVEWVNARQSERNSCLHSSDAALQFTEVLRVCEGMHTAWIMMHVHESFSLPIGDAAR